MRLRGIIVVVLLFVVTGIPAVVWGIDGAEGLSSLSDGEIDKRLRFIMERLDEGQRNAQYWQYGWTGFYAIGSVTQSVAAIDEDDSEDRVNYVVSAVKSAAALTDLLLRPLPARHGADEIRTMPAGTRQENLQRLYRGEELLRANAERARERTSWKPHLTVVGVNLVAGAFIWGFGDGDDAAVSTALGIAVGEAAIWTQPGRATTDLEDYERRFAGFRTKTKITWHIVPIMGGAVVRVSF